MLLQPPNLQKGDAVIILSTARKISVDEIQTAIKTFTEWGLEVILGKTIGQEQNQYAGSDELRKNDFQFALDTPKIKAIICAKGGYGTVRILDELDFTAFLKHPKWIVGFSDITYLHTHINHQLGVQTLHAAMPSTFEKNTTEAIESLRTSLFGEKINFEISAHSLNRKGKAEGILLGGNLSILYSITGTKSGFNTAGKILFLEDLDEYLYHVDRMMMNLKRSGKLENLAGLVVGGMTEMNDNAVPFGKNAEEIIMEHVAEYNYPVCFGFPAGHIADNQALIMGRKMKLEVDDVTTKLY